MNSETFTVAVPNVLDRLNTEIVACRLCSRLVRYREAVARTKKREFQDWEYWGRPLPGFGDPRGRLLIVGLAPAAHGGNRTGRMFTGDSSGQWLMRALYHAGFASQPTSAGRDDGLILRGAYITAVVRCAPPDNRPTPKEIRTCAAYLQREFAILPRMDVVVALGHVAFQGVLALVREQGFEVPRPAPAFAHGARYGLAAPGTRRVTLIASYHPSRQNTQTGRLTERMLDQIFRRARRALAEHE
ncbi:MAG TPA: uracil-DNA glycosylase [bacterium]|nr:uracil-DNA glycosylase [bacterium]